MRKSVNVLLVVFCITACSRQETANVWEKSSSNTGLVCQKSDSYTVKAIYGVDNRLDWFESPGQTRHYWAKATLALIPFGNLRKKDGKARITASTYQEKVGLCPGQPFSEQPAAAFCSAFLVSDDLVVTAGHCIRDLNECKSTHFVFDFAKHEDDQEVYEVPESSVYGCEEIVKRRAGSQDYAVLRLSSKVTDRTPLNVRRQGLLGVGEQVMLIGHPMGLPSKIADGGIVTSVGEKIMASVDAFAANSGSAILNSTSGLVEGILVAGEPDYKYQNGCRVEAVCNSSCQGEVITPISEVLSSIPDITHPNPVCD